MKYRRYRILSEVSNGYKIQTHKYKSQIAISLQPLAKILEKPTITYHDSDIYLFTEISIKHEAFNVHFIIIDCSAPTICYGHKMKS